MTVTSRLLKLFRVDQQLRGLRSRLDAAERFLGEQQRLLADLEARHTALAAQTRTSKAGISGDEGEASTIEARMNKIRDQMNAAKTNKEYSAFLTELNTLKAQKDASEKHALELMEKVQGLETQLAELASQREQRLKIVAQAKADRDQRAGEIQVRLDELNAQRTTLVADVSKDAMRIFDELVRTHGDNAMAEVEVLDHRAHEYTCSACQMTVTVETVNKLVAGNLTRCPSCQCLLFTGEGFSVHRPEAAKKGKKNKAPEQV